MVFTRNSGQVVMTHTECQHKKCIPSTHETCGQCCQELRTRWDCVSGGDFRCHQCEGITCKKCCDLVPKVAWEEFHNQWIKKYKPKCHRCKSPCFVSEGFVSKVDGQMVCFCSHACLDEWHEEGKQEDNDWNIWSMHPPQPMVDILFTRTR